MVDIIKNVNLSKYSTLGVGGEAKLFVIAKTEEKLIEALNYAHTNKIEYVIIGSGSNILFSDLGFDGLVVLNRFENWNIEDNIVTAGSGSRLGSIAKETIASGLLGFENIAGIPGTVGAAVVGNVGIPAGNISDILLSAKIWQKGKISDIENSDLQFSYRHSLLKDVQGMVVISAKFQLKKGDTSVAQEQIKKDSIRRQKSYLGKTAGSYFKNPSGDRTAGEIIDGLGLKGYRTGGAEISPFHANVLRNIGDATAKDFYDLEKYIVSEVLKSTGIKLTPEVVKIGKF